MMSGALPMPARILKKNNCKSINLEEASDASSKTMFDIILANINKNVILANFALLKDELKKDGIMLLSGLLESDKDDILEKAKELHLAVQMSLIRNNWIAIQLSN